MMHASRVRSGRVGSAWLQAIMPAEDLHRSTAALLGGGSADGPGALIRMLEEVSRRKAGGGTSDAERNLNLVSPAVGQSSLQEPKANVVAKPDSMTTGSEQHAVQEVPVEDSPVLSLGAPLSPPPDYLVYLVARLPKDATADGLRGPLQVAMASVGQESAQARVGRAAARGEQERQKGQLEFEGSAAVRVPHSGTCRLTRRGLDEMRPSQVEAALMMTRAGDSRGGGTGGLVGSGASALDSNSFMAAMGKHAVPWSRSGRSFPLFRAERERERDGEEPSSEFGEQLRNDLTRQL